MEFREIEKFVIRNAFRYGEKYQVEIDEYFALAKFYEEIGEFAQALLIHKRKSRPEKYLPEEESREELGKEMADVLGMLIVNAHLLGIDLEAMMKEKWLTEK